MLTCYSSFIICHYFLLTGTKVERRSLSETKDLCSYFSLTNKLSCSYHDSCVESLFQCSSDGFQIGYALPRCRAIKQLHKSDDNCSSCLKHQKLVDWALATEECVQPKLQQLARDWSQKISPLPTPDPQNCLSYETEALNQLKSCYKKTQSSMCDLLSDNLDDNVVSDLEKLASIFAVNDYYKSMVHDHLRELIGQCSANSATETANVALPKPMKKIIFCAAAYSALSDEVLNHVSNILEKPSEQFQFADLTDDSEARDNECQENSPPEGNGGQRTGFRLVQWSPLPSDTLVDNLKSFYVKQVSASVNVFFYKYHEQLSSCGNGMREAGESCDTFGEQVLGNKDFGCDKTCRPISEYECSTTKMKPSECLQSVCGDGLRSSLEECDDGNYQSGDGCSEDCKVEPSHLCTELPYNATSSCVPVPQQQPPSSTIVSLVLPSSTLSTTTSTSTIASSSPTTTTSSSSTSEIRPTRTPSSEPTFGSLNSSAHSSLRTSSMAWWVSILLVLVALQVLLR